MNKSLRKDDVLRVPGEDGARWSVIDPKPRDGWIKIFDYEEHKETYQPINSINQLIVAGKVVLDRKFAPAISPAEQNDPILEEKLGRAMEQINIIEKIQKNFKLTFAEAYEMARENELEGSCLSRATLYRYARNKRNGLPLLRGSKNKGNRTPRYGEGVSELVMELANNVYLQRESRFTMKNLVDYVNDEASGNGLIGKNQSISGKYVKRCLRNNGVVDPERARMNPKLVPAAKSIASARIMLQTPFERVEQDAVHLPFILNTRHGPTSNVYLIHSIDCCTSMPLGWQMVIGAPSESDGLRCVQSILFPKKDVLRKFGLDPSLDVYGTPHQLIFDNGPETRGKRMRKLTTLGIDIKHCKSRHAHGKPFVERLNRSLKEALQILPGSTRFDNKDGQRDPIELGEPVMDVQELERWIVGWYYKDWANTPLERLRHTDFHNTEKPGDTPWSRWKQITEDLATPLPMSPSLMEWRMALYEHHERKLSRKTGITVHGGFSYRGPALPYLVERHGENTVKVLVNPDDYRQIFVCDGQDRPLVPLTEQYVDETTPAHTFNEIKNLRAMKRASNEGEDEAKRFRQEVRKFALSNPGKTTGKKKGRSMMNQEVTGAIKQASAVRRAADAPLLGFPVDSIDNDDSPFLEAETSFDELAALPVYDRMSGEEFK